MLSWLRGKRREPLGFIGMTLAEAGRTEFFAWFNFVPDPGARPGEARFLPGAPAFAGLAALAAQLDRAQRIDAIALTVARRFIDDPDQGMFAADLGKSFLQAALAPADRTPVQHLIDTIAFGGRFRRPTLRHAESPMPALNRDSAPYLVWLGRNPRWERPFAAVRLTLEAMPDGVRIAVRKSDGPPR